MTNPSPSPSDTAPGLFAQCLSEARYSWSVILSDTGRLTRFAIPWFGILFLMALPLPFLGFLDGDQRHGGLDFSPVAAVLALSLHGALWLRCVMIDEFPGDIPLPFGMREVAILIGYTALIGIPLWCWSQAIGLFHSLDYRFVAIHRLAEWFGTQPLIEYGFQDALLMAAVVMTMLAMIASFISLKLSLMLVDLALDKPIDPIRSWRALSTGNALRLSLALLLAALPFTAVAALADQATGLLGNQEAVIGILEFFATMILFPLSAAIAITLARMTKHVGYTG